MRIPVTQYHFSGSRKVAQTENEEPTRAAEDRGDEQEGWEVLIGGG